jgi:hypothetical protein
VQGYLQRYGARKCEANALVVRPEAGRELCRQAILPYILDSGVEEYEPELDWRREQLRLEIRHQIDEGALDAD